MRKLFRILCIIATVASASAQPLGLRGIRLPAVVTQVSSGQPSAITNLVNWPSLVGVEGGIPARTTYITLSSTCTVAQLNGHTSACPSNQQIAFLDGTYDFSGGTLTFKNGVSYRGQGSNTFIKLGANTQIGTTHSLNSVANIGTNLLYSGYDVGSTNLVTIGNTFLDRLTNGCMIILTELNDTNLVHPYGYEEGPQTGVTDCDYPFSTGLFTGIRNRGQVFTVTGINGTNIGIWPPVSGRGYSAGLSPMIHYTRPASAPAVLNNQCWIGFSDLALTNTGGYGLIFEQAQNCWLTNVTIYAGQTGVDFLHSSYAHRISVLHCNFYGYPSEASGMIVFHNTGGFRIENNVFARLNQACLFKGVGGFHFYGYNFSTTTNAVTTLIGEVGSHGAAPQFILSEGNDFKKCHWDSIHGSATDIANVRNRGRSKDSYTGGGHAAFSVDTAIRYSTFVGNELGTPTTVSNFTYEAISPAPAFSSDDLLWRIGYCGYYATNVISPLLTMVREGNIDWIGGTTNIVWSGSAMTVPSSAFYELKPGYFGSTPFPLFGPGTTYTNMSPAEYRFRNLQDPS